MILSFSGLFKTTRSIWEAAPICRLPPLYTSTNSKSIITSQAYVNKARLPVTYMVLRSMSSTPPRQTEPNIPGDNADMRELKAQVTAIREELASLNRDRTMADEQSKEMREDLGFIISAIAGK